MTVRDFRALDGLDLVPFDAEFDLARAVKSDAELESVRESVRINEDGFEAFHGHGARVRGRSRRVGPERRRQRGGDRPSRRRVIRGTTFPPGRSSSRESCSGMSRATRRSARSSRAGRRRRDRAPRRRVHARRDAGRSGRRRARRPVAEGDLQRLDEPDRRPHRPDARARLRAADLRRLVSGLVDEGKAVAAAQGIELDADPEALIDHAAKPEVAYGHKASMLQDVEARRRPRSTG